MCGIAGVIGLDVGVDGARDLVRAMTERIRHRGPDGGGVVAHPDVTLGMARLAIVDIEHGHQPMANEDASVVLVYNGEIYNAPALRASIEAEGVVFKTRSDTEVILRLYERDPEHIETELAGMWAFAIHDRRRRRVVLSRDRFGIKPLFLARGQRALAFGSELRCFERNMPGFGATFEIDHAAAHAMLSWSFIPETATMYRGVRRLAPASRVAIDLATGKEVETIYWRPRPSSEAASVRTLDEACSLVEPALERSVREHLESDVPIATFLSGGVDSSLVTAYAAEASPKRIKAFTIGFREPRFDESEFARQTAEQLGVELLVERFDEELARAHVADALLAYDEPFGDSSSLAVNLLSNRVAREYKVALGGDGGDEAFAGYKKYRVVSIRRAFERVPALRDAVGRALRHVPTRTDRTRGWSELLRTTRRLARGLEGTDAHVYAQLTQVASLATTAPLVAHAADAQAFVEVLEARFADSDGSTLTRMLACDLSNTLPNDMLVKVDRASMAHHLEARVPFLDHRVVEIGLGLPQRFTLGRSGKVVLRTLHERRFGPALARRPKRGFGVPVESWLRGPFARACERLFDASRLDRYGVLSSRALSGGRHRDWVRRDPVIVWHALALATWCEANLGDGEEKARELLDLGS